MLFYASRSQKEVCSKTYAFWASSHAGCAVELEMAIVQHLIVRQPALPLHKQSCDDLLRVESLENQTTAEEVCSQCSVVPLERAKHMFSCRRSTRMEFRGALPVFFAEQHQEWCHDHVQASPLHVCLTFECSLRVFLHFCASLGQRDAHIGQLLAFLGPKTVVLVRREAVLPFLTLNFEPKGRIWAQKWHINTRN